MWRAFAILAGLLGVGGLALVGVRMALARDDRRRARVIDLQARLAADTRIPYRTRRWALAIATAAIDTADRALPDLATAGDEYQWALLIAAVLERESLSGEYLDTGGPSGTGDPTPRPGRKIPVAVQGLVRPAGASKTGEALFLPQDGRGWGRGLWQIDWASHEFARTGAWTDPVENAKYAANLLASLVRQWRSGPDAIPRALASYNAGSSAVEWAVRQGRSPDSVTHGKDYGSDVLARASAIGYGGLG